MSGFQLWPPCEENPGALRPMVRACEDELLCQAISERKIAEEQKEFLFDHGWKKSVDALDARLLALECRHLWPRL